MKTRRQSRRQSQRPSRRPSQRPSQRPSRRPRSNCKKTRQRRTFRRAQRVGGGRKSRRHRSKTLQGGGQHFDPNVKPTRDGLGFKKDIDASYDIDVLNMAEEDLIKKVLAFFKKMGEVENKQFSLKSVNAYVAKDLELNKKFIRVKIFLPDGTDYSTVQLYKSVLATIQLLNFKADPENIYGESQEFNPYVPIRGLKYLELKSNLRHSLNLSPPTQSFSDKEPLTSKNVDLGGNNATKTNKLQLMEAINKIFEHLPVEYKKMLFNKVVIWLVTENTVSYVPLIDEKLQEKNIKITNLSTFEKLMLYLRNTIPSQEIESFLTNTTNNPIAQDIRIYTGLDFEQLSSV